MISKPKIFVSYTIRDNSINIELLSRLEEFLKAFSSPFIDLLHNDSIDKQKRIEDELKATDFFLLLETKNVLDSPWVVKELLIALKLNVPIKIISLNNLMPITNRLPQCG